ncbi:DUF7576 family protein [Haladaptatus sp. NG-SE-30]
MKAVSPQEKPGEERRIEQISTRIVLEQKTETCAHCGSEVRLNRRHKYVSVRRMAADADPLVEEFALCDAECLSGFK